MTNLTVGEKLSQPHTQPTQIKTRAKLHNHDIQQYFNRKSGPQPSTTDKNLCDHPKCSKHTPVWVLVTIVNNAASDSTSNQVSFFGIQFHQGLQP